MWLLESDYFEGMPAPRVFFVRQWHKTDRNRQTALAAPGQHLSLWQITIRLYAPLNDIYIGMDLC
jgi:hypothetical protein